MSSATNVAKSLVSISQFNKGQASRIFDRLNSESQLIVLKNNRPTAFILSPNEYDRLTELEEDYALLLEAYERLEKHGDEPGIPMTDVMSDLGISESDLDEIEDVENADTVDAMLETKRMLNNPTLKTYDVEDALKELKA